MTKQKSGAPTVRETAAKYRDRPIVAEIHPGYLRLRLKGTPERYEAAWETLADIMEMIEAKRICGDIPPRKKAG